MTVTSGTQIKKVTATVLQPKTELIGSISIPYTLSCTLPTVNIYANGSGGNPPYRYDWSTGSTTYLITVNTEGGYRVTITDSNGCSVTQAVRVAGSCRNSLNMSVNNNLMNTDTSINIIKKINMALSPNPTSDQVNLVYQVPTTTDAYMEVKSATGRIMEQRILRGGAVGHLSLETEHWSNGLYFISLRNNRIVQTKMLMVVH